MVDKENSLTRKADVFAGKGSLADRLKKRRQAIESGIEDENTPEKVKERGYKKHSFDEEDPQ
jgi:hypothetical protein